MSMIPTTGIQFPGDNTHDVGTATARAKVLYGSAWSDGVNVRTPANTAEKDKVDAALADKVDIGVLADYVTTAALAAALAGKAETILGKIDLLPHRSTDLPFGWHFCNGGGYSTDSAVGQALAALPANFRSDWGITVSGSTIYLPNLLNGSDGYFLRPVNGTDRGPGSKQGDAMQEITGDLGSGPGTGMFNSIGGAFEAIAVTGNNAMTLTANGAYPYCRGSFKASRVVRTATENRPINVGMTPAIYLGA